MLDSPAITEERPEKAVFAGQTAAETAPLAATGETHKGVLEPRASTVAMCPFHGMLAHRVGISEAYRGGLDVPDRDASTTIR
jgi:hypothetical protein